MYSKYCLQNRNDPAKFPDPGPYSTLQRMELAEMSPNDNCKNEADDLTEEIEKLHRANDLLLEPSIPSSNLRPKLAYGRDPHMLFVDFVRAYHLLYRDV